MKKNTTRIISGNIYKEPQIKKPQENGGQGGWVFGWFAKFPKKEFCTTKFEVKLGDHHKGKKKKGIGFNNKAKTFVVLIKGKMKISFYKKTKILLKDVVLEKPGDFVFYNYGVAHDWIAIKKTRTLTIRWPSIPNDQKIFK
jgi:hypothetical protein